MLNEMSNVFQNALKINKYVWDKSVWLSSTLEKVQKIYFFSWILLPPEVKQNLCIRSWICTTIPRKGDCSLKGDWDISEVRVMYVMLAGIILAHLCHSRPMDNSWTRVTSKYPDCLLKVLGIGVTLVGSR